MGLDFSALWGQAEQAASTGLDNLYQSGTAYVEQQAVQVIQADQNQHVQSYQDSVSKTLATPSSPNSFSSYLSSITQSPVLKNYGVYIAGGVGILLIAGYMLAKGK